MANFIKHLFLEVNMWYVLWQLMANVIYEKNYFDSVLVYIWNIVAIAKWFRICLSGVQFFVCKSSKWNKTKHITNIPLWKKVFQWPFLKNKDNWRRSRKNKWLHVFKHKYSDVILKCVIFLFLVHSLQATCQWNYIYQER